MDFSQDAGETRFCMPICSRIINTDVTEDFTLPDYYPEIRRVLYVKESMLPPARFVSGNKLDVGGVIDYTLVYVSNDSKLCSAPISAEYAFSFSIENANEFEMSEGVSVMVHSTADSSTVRVSSPRKLQIRSHISSRVSAWGKKNCGEHIEGIKDPASIQRRMNEVTCAEIFCESSDVVMLEDEYELPFENCRVALADTSVVVDGYRLDGEVVRINGDVILKMLILCEHENESECVIRRLPFEAESDLIGVKASDSLCRVSGSVTDVAMSIEDGRVTTEASLVLEVCLGQNRRVSYTSDIYSTRQTSEAHLKSCTLPTMLVNKNFNVSLSERIPFEDVNFTSGAQIVDACASATVQDVSCADGRMIFKGMCKYNIISYLDGEYGYCEARAPFKCECDGEGDIGSFDVCVDVLNCRARADGDFLNVDAELGLACTVLGSVKADMLEHASFGDDAKINAGVWTVCYSQGEDTLWDIAKRYGVSCEDVKGDPRKDRFTLIER